MFNVCRVTQYKISIWWFDNDSGFLDFHLPARLRSYYTILGTEYLGDLELVVSQKKYNLSVVSETQSNEAAHLEAKQEIGF